MTFEEQMKKAAEDQAKAFEEFKAVNDARLKAIEAKGHASADYDEKLAKMNEAIDEREDKQAKIEAERKKAQEEIEKKIGRLELGGKGTGAEPDEAKREQKAARLAYLRRGQIAEQKVLQKSDDTAGGYLCGEEIDAAIIKAAVEVSPVRDLVTVRPTSKQTVKAPKLTNAPAMAAKTGEIATRTESTNPAYGLVDIPTHEFYAMHKASHQQLEDSDYDVEAELAEYIGWQFGLREANDIVKGTGVGEPQGFMDASSGVLYTASGVDAKVVDSDGSVDGLIDLIHAVKESYARNGRIVLNRATLGALRKAKDTTKNYIWQPGMGVGVPPTLLGFGYTEIGEMPSIASNAYPIAFGDFKRAYKFCPRIQSSMLRDPYSLSDSGQVKFTVYRRHGGGVVLSEAIRWLKCAAS